MNLLELALKSTVKNERVQERLKCKKNVVTIVKTVNGIVYKVPDQMKEGSLINFMDKYADKIEKFKLSNNKSLII